MATFVLVHGSFHGAWCWFKLVPELEALDHRAVPLDLPAQGADETPVAEVTLDSNVARVVEVIERQSEPVVLVGHSFGGATITATAERVPDRIKRLVYITAFIPRDGESVNDITRSPLWPPEKGARAFARSADGLTVSVAPEAVRDRFYHDCSDEDVARCIERIRPQPFAPRDAPIRTTPERFGRIPRAYIHCADDRSIPLRVQEEFVARVPCDKVVSLSTSHSPFLSAPSELARALSGLVAG
jgi:pimeloyl-ACP methyl ester carboxylesterase